MEIIKTSLLTAFSEALEQLYRPVSTAEFPAHLISVVPILLPGVMLSFDEMSIRTQTFRHQRNFEMPNPAEWQARLGINLQREHPGVEYVRQGGTERLLRLGDFISQRQLRDTALYQENFKDVGIRHQVVMALPIPGYVSGLAINRDRPFKSDEIELLRFLESHIVRAHENAQLYAALKQPAIVTPNTDLPEAVRLTPREQEVLHWVRQGKRDREIAVILGTSHRTVHKHVQRILEKLQVETRSAAAISGPEPPPSGVIRRGVQE